MDISSNKLRQLAAVARCGSFSRAAEELHISQPALSRSIATLEQRCGFAIFNRIGHGVKPTAAGAQLLVQAEPVLQMMRVLDNNLALLATGKAGALKIGLTPLLASEILGSFAQAFFSPANQTELRASIRSGPVLLHELKQDLIELFFFADTQVDPGPEIDIAPVGAVTPACIVRSGHPLAQRSDLTIQDLAEFPWASSVEPPAMRELLNPGRFVCDNYHILRDVVLNTDLVCISTETFVSDGLADGTLSKLVVADFLPAKTTIHVATLKGRAMSPLAETAIRQIGRLLNREPT